MTFRTAILALLLLLPASGSSQGPPGGRAAPPDGRFSFASFNTGYERPAARMAPIEQGPLTIQLSSPSNTLIVKSHQLRLEPGHGGSHAAELAVEFVGKGVLVADLDAAGFSTRLEDEVIVPPQSKTLEGRVRLARVQGGYLVTPEQLPARIEIAIRSRLGNRAVAWCDRVALMPMSNLDCRGLERALGKAVVPLPPPGEGYLLSDAELTQAERGQLDRYLAGAR